MVLKISIVATMLLLAIGVLTEILLLLDVSSLIQYNYQIAILEIIGNVAALIIMLAYGTLMDNKKIFNAIKFLFCLIALGAVFKILHLPAANEIITFSELGILICYTIHFIRKKSKNHLDILKLLFVLNWTARGLFVLNHMSSNTEYYDLFSALLFLVVFCDFGYVMLKKKITESI